MATTAPPRRTIREALFDTVLAYPNGIKRGRRGSRRSSSSSSYLYRSGLSTGRGFSDLLCDVDDDATAAAGYGDTEMEQLGAEQARNVVVLMSDTGGGHRASAEAIRDAFRIEFGDTYRVFFHDVWKDDAGWPLNDLEGSYRFMVKHAGIWKVAFHGTSPRWLHRGYLHAIAALNAKKLEAGLMKYKPDIIISVHPLMQHVPLAVLSRRRRRKGLNKKAVFATVITDLNTCHPTWFHRGVDRCYCPSEEVSKRALEDGLDESQIRVFGLPVRPSFCRGSGEVDLSKEQLREELGMEQGLPAVLLMGGGDGMGPVHKTAKELGVALFDEELGRGIGQMVVVCGRNQVLASALQSMEWKIPVKIRGFEKQMEKWMGACDCIITKAGPGTIAESLIRGLPIILNDYIPGQEVGNVPYVVDNGAGIFCSRPKETADTVARWFTSESDQLRRMSENALKLAQPDAVFHIVRDIHELVQKQGPMFRRPHISLNSSSFYGPVQALCSLTTAPP